MQAGLGLADRPLIHGGFIKRRKGKTLISEASE